ncbi:MAG: hypothetical protein J6Y82_09330 [Bacteroidales bacterium]|nr:hypothetical protein [Bacteroidales bacterium]
MRLLTVILLSCVFCALSAQNELSLPECAVVDSNMLRMPAGVAPQMERFFDKLDSVLLFGKGRVNILHIGGSHVQADFYTNVLRVNIDSLNAGLQPPRGFLFPYSVAKTNNPSNYRVRYGGEWAAARNALRQFFPSQGLSGINISTSDTSAWFSICLNRKNTSRWTTNKVHLLARSLHQRCTPYLIVGESEVVEPEQEETGFCFTLPHNVDSFCVRLRYDKLQQLGPDTMVVRGIYADNDEPGIVYNSIGVNGASVPSYLGCADFVGDLSLVKPDLVVFAIGINDAADKNFTDSVFCANYDKLIANIRSVSPECALIFITNNDSYKRIRRQYRVNENGLVARQAFYQLATKWQAGVWDLFEIMGGLKSMAEWETAGLAARDKIHFTVQGYEIIGKLFFDALLGSYLDYDIKSDPYDY